MTDREMLLIAYGAVKTASDESFIWLEELLDEHLFPKPQMLDKKMFEDHGFLEKL